MTNFTKKKEKKSSLQLVLGKKESIGAECTLRFPNPTFELTIFDSFIRFFNYQF